MFISTDYKRGKKKTMKQMRHHTDRRSKFSNDYFSWSNRLFGNRETFGFRKTTPTVKVYKT